MESETKTIWGFVMQTITIIGTDFKAGATVTFGGVSALNINIVSSTVLTCTPPPHAPATVDIVVTNPDGGTYTKTNGFTYAAFAMFKPAREYEIKINGIDITAHQQTQYRENSELNIIDGYDYDFDGITAEMPLEFRNNMNGRDIIEVFKNAVKVYKGYVTNRLLDFKRQRLQIDSLPLTDYMNKYVAVLALAAQNPTKIIRYLFDTYLPSEYTIGNIIAESNKLAGISVSVDTGTDTINIKALISELCETYDIGIYKDGLSINAFAVPTTWPKAALDIEDKKYLIYGPQVKEKTDKYYDKVILTYKTALGGADATVTSGTGNLTLELTLEHTFCTAAIAQIIADRRLAIVNRNYHTIDAPVTSDCLLKLGDYFQYDNYIFVVTGLEKSSKTQYTLKGIGVLK